MELEKFIRKSDCDIYCTDASFYHSIHLFTLPNDVIECFICNFLYKKSSVDSPITFIRYSGSQSNLSSYVSDILNPYIDEIRLYVEMSYKVSNLNISHSEISKMESMFTQDACVKYISKAETKNWKLIHTIRLELARLEKRNTKINNMNELMGLKHAPKFSNSIELFKYIQFGLDIQIVNPLIVATKNQIIQPLNMTSDALKNVKFSIIELAQQSSLKSMAEEINKKLTTKESWFHGTTIDQAAIIATTGIMTRAGQSNVDFGQGFYLCNSLEDATYYASDCTDISNYATILVYTLKEELDIYEVLDKDYSTIHHSLFIDKSDYKPWIKPTHKYYSAIKGSISNETSRFEEILIKNRDMGLQLCIKNDNAASH